MDDKIYLTKKIDDIKNIIQNTDNLDFIKSLKSKLLFFERCLELKTSIEYEKTGTD